jgi:N-acetylneuraminate lyase
MVRHITGLIAAPYTAMKSDCSVNLDIIERQANFLYNNGVEGVFICGTTGEGESLNTREREDIAKRWLDVSPDGLKVIIHVGGNCLRDCKKLAAHAQEIGAWAVGARTPSFFKPRNVEELVSFCAEIAASAPSLPFYFYHIPSMTAVNLPMISFLEHAADKIPNLAGIKYTHEDLMDYQLCLNFEGGRFDLLFGRDEMLICALSLGARGAVGSTYNFAAPLYKKIIEAFEAGDLTSSRKLQNKAISIIQLLNQQPDLFLAAGKSVMTMLGVDCGPVRAPLSNITEPQYQKLKADLMKLDLDGHLCRDDTPRATKNKLATRIFERKTKEKRISTADPDLINKVK